MRTRPSHPVLSRRSLLLSAGLALLPLAPLPGAAVARAAGATDAAEPSPVPDPLALTGTWTRTADGGRRVTTGTERNALALSEHRTGARAGYSATVTVDPQTPYGVASLVVRAAEDGSAGYAAALDPNLGRVRLFDLANGEDIAAAPFTAAPGTTYTVGIALDGPSLTLSVDGTALIHATDHRYETGLVGLHAYNGTVGFGPPRAWEITTDLTGWTTDGGTWTASPLGLRAQAPAGTNIRSMAATKAHDTVLQTDLLVHAPYAVAALLIRADASGTRGYAVEADPNQGRLRLYRVDGNITLGTYSTTIRTGTAYRLRIEADGPRLRVHWQTDFIKPDGYAPVITAEDTAHTVGHLGVLAYNGAVSFENTAAAGLGTDVHGWTARTGSWTPDLRGIRGDNGLRTAPFAAADLVLRADVTLGSAGAAGLVVHADADGTGGYELRLDAGANRVELLDRATGARLASVAPPVRALVPGASYRLEVRASADMVDAYADGVRTFTAPVTRTQGHAVGLASHGGTAYFGHVHARTARAYFTEPYRPSYHYSPLTGSASDPNGLVHFDGEYHLFHQDQGRWAHAVSTDLVHWQALPVALEWNGHGHCWSGSAVADNDDASGLFGGRPGLIAYYTSFHPDKPGGNQCVRAAYSKDKGRSWHWYATDPVIPNPGGVDGNWDFRDPKVVRDEQRGQWVMVVSGGDHIRFFTSRNLLDWTHTGSFGYGDWVTAGVWECPDFFPMPVDGDPQRTKWVLSMSTGAVRATEGSAAQYFLGDWDGIAFTSDHPAGTVLRTDHGRDFYAAITFDSVPQGRRIWMGWTSNWDYPFSVPTGQWKGQLAIPRELALVTGADGIRLVQRPVAELDALRGTTTTRTGVTVAPGSADPLDGIAGTAYEIEAHLVLPAEAAATECGFRLREKGVQHTLVGYDTVRQRLFVDRTAAGRSDFTQYFAGRTEAPAPTTTVNGERHLDIRLFVDSSSMEAFAGGAAITSLVLPDPDAEGMSFYAEGGTVRIATLKVHRLTSPFRLTGASTDRAPGLTGGEFRSDLGELAVTPGGRWEDTGAGHTGTFDRDSDALSTRELTDMDLGVLVRLGGRDGTGGAASLLWRATADGKDAYCLNIDPDLRVVRLAVRTNGAFDDAKLLARVPALVRRGSTYPVRVLAQGTRIQVFLAGRRIIDTTDATYARGCVGLNVFGGRAAFQDAYATEL
ncbi:GH32 C-terminal domain-containing protein [Streptomyces xantholiticus]